MVVGLCLAFISPIFALCFALFYFDGQRKAVASAAIVGFSVAVGVYGLNVDATSDLYRHSLYLLSYQSIDFFSCFDAGHYKNMFVWDIFCWIVAQTGNSNMLQCFSGGLGYFLISFIVFDYAKTNKLATKSWLMGFLFAFSGVPFLVLVIGLRSGLACVICAFATYIGASRNKYIVSGALFLSACLIHSMAIIFFALWLLIPLFRKSPHLAAALVFFIALGLAALSQTLLSVIPSDGNIVFSILHNAIENTFSYVEDLSGYSARQSSNFNTRVNILFTVLLAVLMVYRMWPLLKNSLDVRRQKDILICDVVIYATVALALAFGITIVLPVQGVRFFNLAFVLGGILLPCSLSKFKKRNDTAYLVLLSIVCLGAILLHGYSIYYGLIDPWKLAASLLFGVPGVFLV